MMCCSRVPRNNTRFRHHLKQSSTQTVEIANWQKQRLREFNPEMFKSPACSPKTSKLSDQTLTIETMVLGWLEQAVTVNRQWLAL